MKLTPEYDLTRATSAAEPTRDTIIAALRALARDAADIETRNQAKSALRVLDAGPDDDDDDDAPASGERPMVPKRDPREGMPGQPSALPPKQAAAMLASMGATSRASSRAPYVDAQGCLVVPCETPTQARARLARGRTIQLTRTTAQLPTERASMVLASMGAKIEGPRSRAPFVDAQGRLVVPTITPSDARRI